METRKSCYMHSHSKDCLINRNATWLPANCYHCICQESPIEIRNLLISSIISCFPHESCLHSPSHIPRSLHLKSLTSHLSGWRRRKKAITRCLWTSFTNCQGVLGSLPCTRARLAHTLCICLSFVQEDGQGHASGPFIRQKKGWDTAVFVVVYTEASSINRSVGLPTPCTHVHLCLLKLITSD